MPEEMLHHFSDNVCVCECLMLFFFFFLLLLGLLCDLLWSDPDKDVQGWGENDRGVSFTFGADVVSKFLNRHDLDLICRAHQVTLVLLFDKRPHSKYYQRDLYFTLLRHTDKLEPYFSNSRTAQRTSKM